MSDGQRDWEELIEKFRKLYEAFEREYWCLPVETVNRSNIKVGLGGLFRRHEWVVKVDVPFKCKDGSYFKAKIQLDAVNRRLFIAGKNWVKSDEIDLLLGGSLQEFSATFDKKYRFYWNQWYFYSARVKSYIDREFVSPTMNTAFLNLRDAAESFFERRGSKASLEQLEMWRMKRTIARMANSLRGVVNNCEISKGTVGPSTTLKEIREIAQLGLTPTSSLVIGDVTKCLNDATRS